MPKFVGRRLKNTSATGYLRAVTEPGKRKQDLSKLPLLCDDCEELFSKLETYFANEIYYPYLDKDIEEFLYDERLLKFLVSMNWRTLIVSYDDHLIYYPFFRKILDETEEDWRSFLLNEITELEGYEHHIMLLDYIDESTEKIPGYQWYTLRACDSTLVGNHETVLSYSKFPWMFLVSSIYPKKLSGWNGTRIENSGTLKKPQEIDDTLFQDFFVNRAKMALDEIGKKHDDKVIASIKKNPHRYFRSESFDVAVAEAKRRRKARKKELPNSIVHLIDIIEKSIDNPQLDALGQRYSLLVKRIVADSLAGLTKKDALAISHRLETTIEESGRKGTSAKTFFETDEFKAQFMVDLSDTKDEQRLLLRESIKELIKNKQVADDRIVVSFSFNPKLQDFPYETAYYIE